MRNYYKKHPWTGGSDILISTIKKPYVTTENYLRVHSLYSLTRKQINSSAFFLSPHVLMHGGLLCVAFCPSVSLCQNTRKKVTRKKFKGHKRSRSKVKVTINVNEKAGGLRPTSSCFISLLRHALKLPSEHVLCRYKNTSKIPKI